MRVGASAVRSARRGPAPRGRGRRVHHGGVAHRVAEQPQRKDRARDRSRPAARAATTCCWITVEASATMPPHVGGRRRSAVKPRNAMPVSNSSAIGGEHRRLDDDRPHHPRQHVPRHDPRVREPRHARRRRRTARRAPVIVAPRTTRSTIGAPSSPNVTIAASTLCGNTASTTRISMIAGITITISAPRLSDAIGPAARVAGEQAERHADRQHHATPSTTDSRLRCPPCISRLSTSRPSVSVPSRLCDDGPREHARQVLLLRTERRDQRRRDADERQQAEERERRDRDRPAQQAAQERAAPDDVALDRAGLAERAHETRTRGSSQPYARSTSRFMPTTITVKYDDRALDHRHVVLRASPAPRGRRGPGSRTPTRRSRCR